MPDYSLLSTAIVPKYMSVASMVMLLYDNILTLDREISSIWQSPWSLGKVLFLLNRYVPLVVGTFSVLAEVLPDPSTSFCRPWYYVETYAALVSFVVAQIIMTLRTYALYKQNKAVLIVLVALSVIGTVMMIVIAVLFTPRLYYQFNPLPIIFGKNNVVGLGCLKNCNGTEACTLLLRLFWTPPMIFDGVVFILTLFSALSYSRTVLAVPLLFVLFRDGFLYFVVVFALSAANFTMWMAVPNIPAVEVFTPIVRAMLSVVCSRLMLNLRTFGVNQAKPGFENRHIVGFTKQTGYASVMWFASDLDTADTSTAVDSRRAKTSKQADKMRMLPMGEEDVYSVELEEMGVTSTIKSQPPWTAPVRSLDVAMDDDESELGYLRTPKTSLTRPPSPSTLERSLRPPVPPLPPRYFGSDPFRP